MLLTLWMLSLMLDDALFLYSVMTAPFPVTANYRMKKQPRSKTLTATQLPYSTSEI